MLDDAGFPNASIVLSNQLDELVMWQILSQVRQEAPREGLEPEAVIKRLVFGVGTQLITSAGDAALGGVYKLVALAKDGAWVPALKLSDSKEKIANPGFKRAWRLYDRRGKATADVLSLQEEELPEMAEITLHHPSDFGKFRTLRRDEVEIEPLHMDVLRQGQLVYDWPDLAQIRETRLADVARLDAGVRRLIHPHIYHVSLTDALWKLKQELVMRAHTRIGGSGQTTGNL
jgi:nicotinate phosphoribosyltransferase